MKAVQLIVLVIVVGALFLVVNGLFSAWALLGLCLSWLGRRLSVLSISFEVGRNNAFHAIWLAHPWMLRPVFIPSDA
jgi:hypothetical protein